MMGVAEGRNARWGKVQAWWFQKAELDADHLVVLAALSIYADPQGFCDPSQSTLAAQVKRSRPWVNRVIGDLARLGLIEKATRRRRHNNGMTSCQYRLAFAEDMSTRPVTNVTRPIVMEDTPCPQDDTIQKFKELNQCTPTRREPPSDTVTTESACDTEAVPDGWVPSEEAITEARRLCSTIDLERHAEMFALKRRAKDYRYAKGRIEQAWLSWIA